MNYRITIPNEIHELRTRTFLDKCMNNDIINVDIQYDSRLSTLKLIFNNSTNEFDNILINNYNINNPSIIEARNHFSSTLYKVVTNNDFNEIEFHISGYPNEIVKLVKIPL